MLRISSVALDSDTIAIEFAGPRLLCYCTSQELRGVVLEGAGSVETVQPGVEPGDSASKKSIRRFVITEKAPTRAFSWLKMATTAFTFKTLC